MRDERPSLPPRSDGSVHPHLSSNMIGKNKDNNNEPAKYNNNNNNKMFIKKIKINE